jgi:hypothetical protein
MGQFEEKLEDFELQMMLEAPAFEKMVLNEPRMLGAEVSKYSKAMKPKKEKYLISISKEFSEELIIKLGKEDGVSWEYLLKKLLEKVEGKE